MAARPRARELGVPFGGTPGLANDIADVSGVQVGHANLIRGEGPRILGQDLREWAPPRSSLGDAMITYQSGRR